MRLRLSCLLLWSAISLLPAQWRRAYVTPEGGVAAEPVPAPAGWLTWRGSPSLQISGFPKAALPNPTFRNFRNVTLADLDGRPGDDILWGANDYLYAYSADTLLWEKPLIGVAVYPASVGEVDGREGPDIVLATALTGRLYAMDRQGNDLPGWPRNFSNNWLAAAPALADVDGDGKAEILVNELAGAVGKVHLLRADGATWSSDWPVTLDARAAVTPSVGDVDGDGAPDVVAYSTQSRYVFGLDGRALTGWPLTTGPRQRYSYQSPILADLDPAAAGFEIIGATHGSNLDSSEPYFFVDRGDGTPLPGWPIEVPENSWTYSTPTVIPGPDGYIILMSRPLGLDPLSKAVLFAWDPSGTLLPGFPIVKVGGWEGMISVADVDGDGAYEILFGSDLIDDEGYGFIHAYELDGSGEAPGFPLRLRGVTTMNGATLGDVNGDQQLDLVALSYTLYGGTQPDTLYLNVFELGVRLTPVTVAWGTYKGGNTRAGVAPAGFILADPRLADPGLRARLWPNPTAGTARLEFGLSRSGLLRVDLYSAEGRRLKNLFAGQQPAGIHQLDVDLSGLPAGLYGVVIRPERGSPATLRLVRE